MKTKGIFSAIIIAATLIFTSCEEKNNEPAKGNDILEGRISKIQTLDANTEYKLSGTVIIESGGELIIPAGTVIKAKEGFSNYLLVAQGGKITARGTAEKPIIFTSDSSNPTRGFWGGLIINGKAPISGSSESGNEGSTEVATEFKYGGTNPNDNSGTLSYVMLLYTGANNGDDVEHNGLTLNGVGNGTTINNIYIKDGNDDSIEFFGGTVNVNNLLSVNADDDMFDFTQGYSGTLSNCYGVWESGHRSTEEDPRGVEADGNLDGNAPDHKGQSVFTIKDMTIEIQADSTGGVYMHDAIKVRRGATANIINALVCGEGFVKDLVDVTDKKGAAKNETSISVSYSLKNKPFGKELNLVSKDKNGNINNEGYTYDNVKISKNNSGANKQAFQWTKYNFK